MGATKKTESLGIHADVVWDAAVEQEYEAVAEWCARRRLRGVAGDPLPPLISGEVVGMMHSDPDAFERRVRDYAYALAMEATHAKYGDSASEQDKALGLLDEKGGK